MTNTTKSPPLITEAEAARLTEHEQELLDRAQAELNRAKNRGNKDIAKGKIERIDRGRRNRADAVWRRGAMAETADLARARGEEVEDGGGLLRITSRDGLHRLRTLGHITDSHLQVALLYRAGYEARGADLKAQTIGDSSGGGHDNDAYVAVRLQRAKLLAFVARVDRAVALGCISNPMALRLLRSVAGEGTAITVWGHGRALARNREAIVAALEIAKAVALDVARAHPNGTAS